MTGLRECMTGSDISTCGALSAKMSTDETWYRFILLGINTQPLQLYFFFADVLFFELIEVVVEINPLRGILCTITDNVFLWNGY